jgi:hypothetical protein
MKSCERETERRDWSIILAFCNSVVNVSAILFASMISVGSCSDPAITISETLPQKDLSRACLVSLLRCAVSTASISPSCMFRVTCPVTGQTIAHMKLCRVFFTAAPFVFLSSTLWLVSFSFDSCSQA